MSSSHYLFKSKVFLGFEDEEITKRFEPYLCYSTNKVGGRPDWGEDKHFSNPTCLLCGLTLPLIIQIYAPLEASIFHRTLYLFGCVNPTCWNKKESWVCLRRQLLDISLTKPASDVKTLSSFDWCEGANDWVDFDMDNISEPPNNEQETILSDKFVDKMAELDVNETKVEDNNSNESSNQTFIFPMATAELDDDQRDPVTVETLVPAQIDVASIYQQVKPVPKVPSDSLQFLSFFISVSEEKEEKPLDITNNYEFNIKGVVVEEEPSIKNQHSIAAVQDNNDEFKEKYEKTLPAHGDKLFHNLISRIQRNPGQLIRYIRDSGTPLFLYPAEDVPQHCQHCQGDLVYELQVLPTLISRLVLHGSGTGHIEYGTVFILACKQSCWNSQDNVRTEYVLVQREL